MYKTSAAAQKQGKKGVYIHAGTYFFEGAMHQVAYRLTGYAQDRRYFVYRHVVVETQIDGFFLAVGQDGDKFLETLAHIFFRRIFVAVPLELNVERQFERGYGNNFFVVADGIDDKVSQDSEEVEKDAFAFGYLNFAFKEFEKSVMDTIPDEVSVVEQLRSVAKEAVGGGFIQTSDSRRITCLELAPYQRIVAFHIFTGLTGESSISRRQVIPLTQ
jgi:hypothetical protein